MTTKVTSGERGTLRGTALLRWGGAALAVAALVTVGCADDAPVFVDAPVHVSELMASNDGVWIDEIGETDDWVELVNDGDEPLSLDGFTLGDRIDALHRLPAVVLEPGAVILLWADGSPEQGPLHLPFKLSSEGEELILGTAGGDLVDRIPFPALTANTSFARLPITSEDGALDVAFAACRYPTPGRDNGESCVPPAPTELPEEVTFAPFTWPTPWPLVDGPLVIAELALRPASFVEVVNVSDAPVELAGYALRVAEHGPGAPWPAADGGALLPWDGAGTLPPGERVVVPVDALAMAPVAARAEHEGVVTLFDLVTGDAVERVDFMWWPEGAILTRPEGDLGRHRFCAVATPGEANTDCDPLPSRETGDRLRHLRTPGDFAALAEGGTSLNTASVKVVLDMDAGDVVHLLSSRAWDLHYTFVREQIDGEAHLDRCDPEQATIFRAGWGAFSAREYAQAEGRRFLLGTLEHYGGSDLRTVEFTTGDQIVADQMVRGFFGYLRHVEEPSRWALRAQGARQVEELRGVEGTLPILGPNAPFRGLRYQPLTEAVGYGVLRFVPTEELDSTPLGRDVIVVTEDVPNDIAFVGGLITEAFQTPLAHVNILSRGRGTPNMALRDARQDPALAPFFDQLVRLSVSSGGFEVSAADPAEAEAFWESRLPTGPRVTPRLDTTVRGIVPLSTVGIESLPFVGAKAAQLAELGRINSGQALCPGPIPLPTNSFAIPVAHYLDHFTASGAAALLEERSADPAFRADPAVRAEGLALVRDRIHQHPVDPALLGDVEAHIRTTYGEQRLRFRSTSNTEDLPTFNGAGLYTSFSGALGDPDRPVQDAIRGVWGSLWNLRAYDEREHARIDQSQVAMGILVHPAFRSERANGVAVSRNVLDPVRSDYYYLNAQRGEASVTNPAPGVTTDELVYRWGRSPRIVYQSRSSLSDAPVLDATEADVLMCTMAVIHNHFRALLDPTGENRWFTMETEFKLVGEGRWLLIKQARPYSFGSEDVPTDCREF